MRMYEHLNKVYQDSRFQDALVIFFFDFMCALNPQSSQNEHYKYCTTLFLEENYLDFQS